MQAAKKKIHEICCSHLQHEKIFSYYLQIKFFKKFLQTAEKKFNHENLQVLFGVIFLYL